MRRFLFSVLLLSGCVTPARNRHEVLAAYKKGLKVGIVIGRDNVLGELKSPDCFKQTADELMNESTKSESDGEKESKPKTKRIKP